MTDDKNCQGCGKAVKDKWRLCPFCGQDLPREEMVATMILVHAERMAVEDVAAKIATFDMVRDCFVVTGEADIVVKAAAPSFSQLRNFVVDSIGGTEGVRDTRTYMVVGSLKERKTGFPDPGKDPVRTVLLIKANQSNKDDISERLINDQNVEDVLLVSGDADIVVKALFPSYGNMKKFVSETVTAINGVKEQKTFMAVTVLKEHGEKTAETIRRVEHDDLKDIYFKIPEEECEVTDLLTNLPRGVPSSLWGLEFDELVQQIMKAEYALTPRGFPIMKIKNKWFRGDLEDPSTYLQPYSGDVIKKK
jgi:DNA-binding Lrp family transcriptional regulator